MSLGVVGLIGSNFNGELGTTSSIFNVADGVTAALTISIPRGFTFFLLDMGGVVTGSDLRVQFRDKHNTVLAEWAEFPDVSKFFKNFAVLTRGFDDNINFSFKNSVGSSQTVTFAVNGVLIPNQNVDDFKKAVFDFVLKGGGSS